MNLHPYQADGEAQIYQAWDDGHQVVMYVLDTGGGKTVVFCSILRDHDGVSCVMAHRNHIVSQISMTLARNGVEHRIVGQRKIIVETTKQQVKEYGRSYIRPNAPVVVASIGTIRNCTDRWIKQVSLWVGDEGHHYLRENEFGKAVAKFPPSALGLLTTATPERADGHGLGRSTDGLADTMVIGPCGRELIDMGFKSDYIIHCPDLPKGFDVSQIPISPNTGDFNQNKLVAHSKEAKIIGDVVMSRKKFAGGLLGISYTMDVESAEELTADYNANGIPAALVTGKTSLWDRYNIQRRFKRGDLQDLVNVDVFTEGYDLPELRVVSDLSRTMSVGKYRQRFGRNGRVAEGKPYGIYIDYVGNFEQHKFPDLHRAWTLDRRERRTIAAVDIMPTRRCLNPLCFQPFYRYLSKCPKCGWYPTPQSRTRPEHVDGDLAELSLETLAAMRAQVMGVQDPFDPDKFKGIPYIGVLAQEKRHRERITEQSSLAEAIDTWGEQKRVEGHSDSESWRKFYHEFGVDVLTAQSGSTKEMKTLKGRLK